MSKVTEFTVSYSRRVQLERYEPVEHGGTITVEVGPDDEWGELYEAAAVKVEGAVERELARRVAAAKQEDEG